MFYTNREQVSDSLLCVSLWNVCVCVCAVLFVLMLPASPQTCKASTSLSVCPGVVSGARDTQSEEGGCGGG